LMFHVLRSVHVVIVPCQGEDVNVPRVMKGDVKAKKRHESATIEGKEGIK
jgi:hypothetical protein